MPFRSDTDLTISPAATTTATAPIPAGVQPGDRVYAFVGTGGATPVTVTAPAGWVQDGPLYQPTGFMASGVWHRDITSTSEAGTSATWTFSVSSRTWIGMEAYSDVDLSRVPLVNVTQGVANSAGPSTAPAVVLPSQDWLKTYTTARQSPGTDDPKSWSISPADTLRSGAYQQNTGTGQKLVVSAWDSAGTVTATNGVVTTQSTTIGPQAPPTNTYNATVTSAKTYLLGATVKKEELDYWQPKFAGLDWMRVFPDSDGLPPDWTDPRIQFVRAFGGQVFLSSKVDGDSAKLTALAAFLRTMPSWILNDPDPDKFVWITDRHEPEGDVTAAQYQANFTAFYNMIQGLPSNIRARIKAGPVLTRQYTENTAGRTYAAYDPGVGDFFGVDMYPNSWGSPSSTVATSFPNAVTFLSRFKAYTKDGKPAATTTDHRLRVMPELGGIGVPNDTDGTLRAQWFSDVFTELGSWTYAAQGWTFAGICMWATEGKSGTSLTGAGTKRWFTFDRRHTGTDGSYAIISSVAAMDSGSSSGGSSATDRRVSTSQPVSTSHVWTVSVPMTAPVVVDPSTVNAWSHLGLPQR